MEGEADSEKSNLIIKKLSMIEKLSEQQRQVLEANWEILLTLKDLSLKSFLFNLQKEQLNPFNKFGRKCFSQTDEDGITLEIIRRLGIKSGFFAEFGVGNGFENNTLVLAALGWKGFWIGNQNLEFNYHPSKKFVFIKQWINLQNISNLTKSILTHFKNKVIDVISLDLDGNDFYLVKNLLENKFCPKLFIIEYNAKFPPPIYFEIDYDENHIWKGDDYYGASLSSFNKMFEKFEYSLICCNAHSGTNAFFIKNEFMSLFEEVPTDISDIYVEPRRHVLTKSGFTQSPKVIEKILSD